MKSISEGIDCRVQIKIANCGDPVKRRQKRDNICVISFTKVVKRMRTIKQCWAVGFCDGYCEGGGGKNQEEQMNQETC